MITPDDFVVVADPPPTPAANAARPGLPEVTVGSTWEGADQESWWLILYPSPDRTRWRALCLRAPRRYPWVEAGEEWWLPAERFGDGLVPL